MIKKVNVNKYKNQLGNISTLIFKNINNIQSSFPCKNNNFTFLGSQ